MRIQFELGQKSHGRHQTTVIDSLRSRGHEVVETACTTDCPGLIRHEMPAADHRDLLAFFALIRDDDWGRLSYTVRTARDYLRYVRPEHRTSEIIRRRARNMLEIGFDDRSAADARPWLALLDGLSDVDTIDRLDRSLATVEESFPPHPAMIDYVRSIAADVFCVTPMLMTQYGQADLVKAAMAERIPVVFLAGSWDNLTTKGTTHVVPDRTLVWNDIQIEEAERFHAIPRDTVRAVGAPRFDEYWEREIEMPYDRHCAEYGLDPARDTFTYLGSSNLIVKDETRFVRQWIDALRTCPVPAVATANILLRPHPKFSSGWKEAFSGLPQVGLSLSKLLNNDTSLFHAMAHSRVVVGANTSAELEAAILGCPVFTIKDPTFSAGQDGTIHFGYLAGDLAKVATSLEEHVSQLVEEVSAPKREARNDTFLRSFLRPMGLDRRASDATADAIEEAAALAPAIRDEIGRAAVRPASPTPIEPLRGWLRGLRSRARALTNGR